MATLQRHVVIPNVQNKNIQFEKKKEIVMKVIKGSFDTNRNLLILSTSIRRPNKCPSLMFLSEEMSDWLHHVRVCKCTRVDACYQQ